MKKSSKKLTEKKKSSSHLFSYLIFLFSFFILSFFAFHVILTYVFFASHSNYFLSFQICFPLSFCSLSSSSSLYNVLSSFSMFLSLFPLSLPTFYILFYFPIFPFHFLLSVYLYLTLYFLSLSVSITQSDILCQERKQENMNDKMDKN